MFLHLPHQDGFSLPNTAIVYFSEEDQRERQKASELVEDVTNKYRFRTSSRCYIDTWLPGWYYWFFDHEGEFQPRVPTGPYETAQQALEAVIKKANWNAKRVSSRGLRR